MSIQNDLLVDALFPAHQRTKMMMKARKAVVPKYTERTVSGNPAVLTNTTAGLPLTGLKLNGKSTQESTTGAQLLDISSAKECFITGVSVGDKVVETKNDSYKNSTCYNEISVTPGTYYLRVPKGEYRLRFYSDDTVVTQESRAFSGSTTIGITSATTKIRLMSLLGKIVGDAMISASNTALPWEPYTGGMPSPNPDYPQEIKSVGDSGKIPVTIHNDAESQDVNIPTPNGLLGIPVDSDGNLTDSSGQQWICDEIDFTRKVYVQRCVKKVLNGTESWKAEMSGGVLRFVTTTAYQFAGYSRRKALISHFYFLKGGNEKGGGFVYVKNILLYPVAAGETMSVEDFTAWLKENPVTVVAPLYTPKEIPLTDEQIQAFESMHTYDGTTTVETQEDVSYMEVGYKIPIPKPSSNEVLGRWFKQHPLI